MQLFDEYEKFVQRCDIEHKQLILIGDINSDYAKTPLDVPYFIGYKPSDFYTSLVRIVLKSKGKRGTRLIAESFT